VVRTANKETTALGAAYAAGLAVNYFAGVEELRANWSVDRTWQPEMENSKREELYKLWHRAVSKSFDWVE